MKNQAEQAAHNLQLLEAFDVIGHSHLINTSNSWYPPQKQQ